MHKNIVISFLFSLLLSIFWGAGTVFAADCNCQLQVGATIGADSCNIDKSFSYSWGESVSLQDLILAVPAAECPQNVQGNIVLLPDIDNQTQFTRDEATGENNCDNPAPNDPPRQYQQNGINLNFACSAANPAAQPGQCACSANVDGLLCTASAQHTFAEGEQLNLRQFVSSLLTNNGCNLAASAAESFVPDQNVVVDATSCNSVNLSGSEVGHTYSVQCSYSGQSSGAAGGTPTLTNVQPDKIENKLPEVELPNPLKEVNLNRLIGRIIKEAMGILGSITLVVFIYGGYLFLTAAGNEEKVKKGGRAMAYAAVGIFIILTSYVILNTIFRAVF
ncbi:MAG: hypothetical protein COV59_04550 [Candidatus Magasanikbacteria bacterium CG11_big_fil_rev_8_21_14_0_20_39_34]|uniref:Uncharacterized protein n=1 Tax=Candidatus Magasanikbacteria bacterium CG11_big_fil_rev_8_21_14_0_20_39_34 TaxID=1974653 RepID=A0A2H0N497_9BACT|nr:MAG: hypothetical protein COV59_04550 [Candidatus Magasanikbacteria bacterium CG11_big_fil_rev_8_21_14_0_20_39_34]